VTPAHAIADGCSAWSAADSQRASGVELVTVDRSYRTLDRRRSIRNHKRSYI
jgi:hypothetical protein